MGKFNSVSVGPILPKTPNYTLNKNNYVSRQQETKNVCLYEEKNYENVNNESFTKKSIVSSANIKSVLTSFSNFYSSYLDAKAYICTKYESLLDKVKSLNDTIKYKDVKSFSYEEIYNDGYTPQGFTRANQYAIISAYKSGENEMLYFYDRETGKFVKSIKLDVGGHAGGTTYDPDNGLLYVTEKSNKISVYDYNILSTDVLNGDKNVSDAYLGYVCLPSSDSSPATITYSNGTLYASTFVGSDKGVTFGLNVKDLMNNNKDGDKILTDVSYTDYSPRLVQGMVVTDYDGETYQIYAQSIKFASWDNNWMSNSSYCVYKIDENGKRSYLGKYYSEEDGLEGIQINEANEIMGVYEYENKTTTITMDELLNNLVDSDWTEETKRDASGNMIFVGYDQSHNTYHYSDYLNEKKGLILNEQTRSASKDDGFLYSYSPEVDHQNKMIG